MPRLYIGDCEFGRCPYGGSNLDEPRPGQLYVKVSGVWHPVINAYYKVSGSWVKLVIWQKISGTWDKISV